MLDRASALVLLALAATACRGEPEGPSVLLVTIDTLRADHVGVYGAVDARTPTLDSLARGGIRFENAIAPTPLTLPSHASILTGLYPTRHGVRHNGLFRLDEGFETLAERIQAEGYVTGAIVGAIVLAKRYALGQGFEHYDDEIVSGRAGPSVFAHRSAEQVSDRALEWLSKTRRPFFLWLHYYDPHGPNEPPEPYASQMPGAPYSAEIAYVDAQLARVIEALRDSGRLDQTLVVVTADHGENLNWEHQDAGHSYSLYDSTQRVPLIFHGPGVPVGRTADSVVSTVDLAPSILAILGLAALPDADGRDLSPLWRASEAFAARPAYAESLATQFDHGWSPVHALRSDRYLYIEAPDPELYDVTRDPAQLHDLLADEPLPEADALRDQLKPIVDAARETPRSELDPEALSQLRALGYAISEGPVAYSGIDPKQGLVGFRHFIRARELLELQQYPAALAEVKQSLEISPQSPAAHLLIANVYFSLADYPRALEHIETASRLVPESTEYLARVGDVQSALGNLEAAEQAYSAAREGGVSNPMALVGLMRIASRRRDRSAAAQYAQEALDMAGGDVTTLLAVAYYWLQLGDLTESESVYRRALELEPGAGTAHAQLALVLIRRGQLEEADRHWEQGGAMTQAPALRNELGIAYLAGKQPERAEAVFRALLREYPEASNARLNLQHLLRAQGRSEEAERVERGES